MRHRRRHMSFWLAALTAAAAALQPLLVQATGSVALSPTHLPSFMYDTYRVGADSADTMLFTDAAAGTLFEWDEINDFGCDGSSPANAAAYATSPATTSPTTTACLPPGGFGAQPVPVVAVDPLDHLVVVANLVGDLTPMLLVYDETTLRPVGSVQLPTGSMPGITGLSWSAVDDGVLVASGRNNLTLFGAGPGVSLLEYHGADLRHSGSGPVAPAWTTLVPAPVCTSTPSPLLAGANPYRSSVTPDVYLACDSAPSPVAGGSSYAVLDVHLDAGGAPLLGGLTLTPAPGGGEGFLFDPSANRGYVLSEASGSVVAHVYDGAQHAFIDSAVVTSAPSSWLNPAVSLATGIDEATGRLYVFSKWGLSVVDGAATPVPAVRTFADTTTPLLQILPMPVPVLPADATHPHPRILVPHQASDPTGVGCPPWESISCVYDAWIDVYEDLLT
jgi:hypothetical protein